MPRKKVTRLRKFCGLLAGHAWQQAERVSEAVTDLVRDWLPEHVEKVDLEHLLMCIGEKLDHHRDRLTEIDNQHTPRPPRPGAQILAATESESKHSQSLKDAEVEDVDVFSGKAIRFLEALVDLAGLDRLSDRLRRSSHRAANSVGEDDEPAPGNPGDPGEAAPRLSAAAPVSENG